jgi:maltose-binding protein MalE
MLQRFKIISLLLIIIFAIILTLRTAYLELAPTPASRIAGTILVWHSWELDDAPALQEAANRFMGIYPETRVILTRVEPGLMLERFQDAAEIGFGPDLFIGPNEWIPFLVDNNLVLPIDDRVGDGILDRYTSATLETLRYRERLYGLPLALHTLGLFYNQRIVSEPATSLDELMSQAQAGVEVGLNTSFEGAFWGIRAFGGRLFDEEQRIALDQGGFANWLNWLRNAQDVPNFVLSTDQIALRTLFMEGRLGYLVDNSRAWRELTEGMEGEPVGVAPLPIGPIGAPAPFLRAETLLFSAASSKQQVNLAVAFAQFATNTEQQTMLMRQTRRVPANLRVRINPRINPYVSAFATQARLALPYPLGEQAEMILRLGTNAFNQVLEGVLTPAEAATETTLAIDQELGYDVAIDEHYQCTSVGDFTLWHSWEGVQAQALARVIEHFRADCPNIFVRVQYYTPQELLNRISTPMAPGNRPDLLLLPNRMLLPLISTDAIRPIGPLIEPELLQRYRPNGLNAFRVNDRLYGLPIILHTDALIYRADLVDAPAQTLNDLLLQSAIGQRIGLRLDFVDFFWGVPAFGGQFLNANNQFGLDPVAFAQWLSWLHEAEQRGALVLSQDDENLDRLFLEGEISYRVADPMTAARFIEELGSAAVGVIPLPSGPEGDAGPLITADGFVISTLNEARVPPLLEFARYATRAESQRLLVEVAPLIPANANVDVTTDPLLGPYAEQLSTAVLYPNRPEMAGLADFGGDSYVWVRSGVLTPKEAAAEIMELIGQTVGGSSLVAESIQCAGSGPVALWHVPLDGRITAALDAVADQFNTICPDITLSRRSFEAGDDLLAALEAGETGGTALLLGPGRWAIELAHSQQIIPAERWVDQAVIRRILPAAVESVQVNRQVYGLPLTIETTALYVNRARISTPPVTLEGILDEARAGRRVALLTDDGAAVWGMGAFAGAPGVGVTNAEQNQEWPDEAALVAWFNWLRQAELTPGVVIGDEAGRSQALFASGRLAYYMGSSQQIGPLRQALGAESISAIPMPPGPAGPASPLLRSQALYFPSAFFSTEANSPGQQAAISFALYLSGIDAQTLLMEQADQVPANRLVDTNRFPLISGFITQSATALPDPPLRDQRFVEILDMVTEELLSGRLTPEDAARRFLELRRQGEG